MTFDTSLWYEWGPHQQAHQHVYQPSCHIIWHKLIHISRRDHNHVYIQCRFLSFCFPFKQDNIIFPSSKARPLKFADHCDIEKPSLALGKMDNIIRRNEHYILYIGICFVPSYRYISSFTHLKLWIAAARHNLKWVIFFNKVGLFV